MSELQTLIENNKNINEENGERICRICLETEEENSNELINPCLCNGSSKWIHKECLNEWRATSLNPDAFIKCMTCHYTYKMESYNSTKTIFKSINSFLSAHIKTLALINFIIGITISYFIMLIDASNNYKLLSQLDGNYLLLYNDPVPSYNPFSIFFIYCLAYSAPISSGILSLLIGFIVMIRFLQLKNKRLYLLNCAKCDKLFYIIVYLCISISWPIFIMDIGIIGALFTYFICNLYLSSISSIIIHKHYSIINSLDRAQDTKILNYDG